MSRRIRDVDGPNHHPIVDDLTVVDDVSVGGDASVTGTLSVTGDATFAAGVLTSAGAGTVTTAATTAVEEHGDALTFRFTGTVDGETMTGTLDMGEYLHATWKATRG